jgi:hypothetical protein
MTLNCCWCFIYIFIRHFCVYIYFSELDDFGFRVAATSTRTADDDNDDDSSETRRGEGAAHRHKKSSSSRQKYADRFSSPDRVDRSRGLKWVEEGGRSTKGRRAKASGSRGRSSSSRRPERHREALGDEGNEYDEGGDASGGGSGEYSDVSSVDENHSARPVSSSVPSGEQLFRHSLGTEDDGHQPPSHNGNRGHARSAPKGKASAQYSRARGDEENDDDEIDVRFGTVDDDEEEEAAGARALSPDQTHAGSGAADRREFLRPAVPEAGVPRGGVRLEPLSRSKSMPVDAASESTGAARRSAAPTAAAAAAVPPLALKRQSSEAKWGEESVKFTRPMIRADNAEKARGPSAGRASVSQEPADGFDQGVVLDWRNEAGGSSPSFTIDPLRTVSPEEFSVLWEDLDVKRSRSIVLTPSAPIAISDMLAAIEEHLQSRRFRIIASGLPDDVVTVYAYAGSAGAFGASEFLLELKVAIVPVDNELDGWDIRFTCKFRGPPAALLSFLQELELDALFGSKELEADNA